MAHKKGQGSTSNNRDSQGQRRGVKRFGGEWVKPGMILVRQLGSRIHAGFNVGCGSDYTLFSKINGRVVFERKGKTRKRVSVYPKKEGKALVMGEDEAAGRRATQAYLSSTSRSPTTENEVLPHN